ncbi:hypothetical protein L083_2288 [Actinoplanes sp. N902-109]|nr:hypothetical protein L083_2288 [Actinoplanes sp. N902-109]
MLTVAVKVLTASPFLSRLWAKFSNRYLRHAGKPTLRSDVSTRFNAKSAKGQVREAMSGCDPIHSGGSDRPFGRVRAAEQRFTGACRNLASTKDARS